MLHNLTFRLRCLLALLFLTLGVRSADAFCLLGTKEAFETQTLGFIIYITDLPLPHGGGWTVFTAGDFSSAPKNIGQGYRWNVPILYYAFDENFLSYFGAQGAQAVDSAAGIINSVGNVDAYSPDLSEIPTEELGYNYTATALGMFDVKSAALEVLLERLGLGDPQHWAFCVRDKFLLPTLACPNYEYEVVQRNFDPATWQPSGYINGNLFTYAILQVCPPDIRGDFSDAEATSVDPTAPLATAVATPKILFPKPGWLGAFHTGLTRDDVGGLRYLYSTNTLAWEAMSAGTSLLSTNTTQGSVLITSNLTLFAQQALTTNALALQALYPGLIITASTNWPVVVWQTNLTAFFTNSPYDPVGTPPHLAFLTNVFPTVQLRFQHTFANAVSFQFVNGAWTTVPISTFSPFVGHGFVSYLTTVATNSPWSPVGSLPVTNSYIHTILTNEVVGDFTILPTNSCSLQVVFPLLTNVASTTNLLITSTNFLLGTTNITPGTTNQFFTQSQVDWYTNHVFWVYQVNCLAATNAILLRPGIEKISYVRRDFDSLLGRFFFPITNQFTITTLTNNQFTPLSVLRVVTAPDIVFSAADLADFAPFPGVTTVARTVPVFDISATPPGEPGPGTIEGPATFTFNKVGGAFINGTAPLFLSEAEAVQFYTWASFDASPNPPFVYPVGVNITNLLNQVPMTILPPVLPDASISSGSYTNQLSGTGGQPPYTFTLTSGSLPPGLALAPSGAFPGAPTAVGTYAFTVQMSDNFGRFVNHVYVLNVTP